MCWASLNPTGARSARPGGRGGLAEPSCDSAPRPCRTRCGPGADRCTATGVVRTRLDGDGRVAAVGRGCRAEVRQLDQRLGGGRQPEARVSSGEGCHPITTTATDRGRVACKMTSRASRKKRRRFGYGPPLRALVSCRTSAATPSTHCAGRRHRRPGVSEDPEVASRDPAPGPHRVRRSRCAGRNWASAKTSSTTREQTRATCSFRRPPTTSRHEIED